METFPYFQLFELESAIECVFFLDNLDNSEPKYDFDRLLSTSNIELHKVFYNSSSKI